MRLVPFNCGLDSNRAWESPLALSAHRTTVSSGASHADVGKAMFTHIRGFVEIATVNDNREPQRFLQQR
jgi:hypothetical protein